MVTDIPIGKDEILTIGRGGWMNYRTRFASGHDNPQVWVRLEERSDGRLIATEFHTSGLSPADLRAIPFGRIEAAANEEGVRARVHARIKREGDQAGEPLHALRKLAPSRKELRSRALSEHEAGLAPFVGLGGTLRARPRPGEKGPDDFYRDIGAIYERLAATTGRPAPDLARQAGVSVSTVHRWVKEARRRGLMAPGRRG